MVGLLVALCANLCLVLAPKVLGAGAVGKSNLTAVNAAQINLPTYIKSIYSIHKW